jgi:hypothetical protein
MVRETENPRKNSQSGLGEPTLMLVTFTFLGEAS